MNATARVSLFAAACMSFTGTIAGRAGAAEPGPPHRFESEHQGPVGDQRIRYRAVVEEHFTTDAAGTRTASIYTTSYLRTDAGAAAASRPVIFAFNGGPGSSSVWLHLGFLAPMRVDAGEPSAPNTVAPFRYVDNPDSPLDVADIVMIDPPGTGYSRVLPGGKPEQFFAADADARMTVDLMREWLRANGRTNSPKYIISESYGTIRAALVAKLLAGGPMSTGRMDGIALNGVVLLGQALDFKAYADGDTAYLTALPTLAATACYHGKAPPGCTASGQAKAARVFARDVLLPALYQGSALDSAGRNDVAAQLAGLIGVDRQLVLDHDLRISAREFSQLLLKTEGKRIGGYDARYLLPVVGAGQDPVADDPAMGQYVPAFLGAWADYSRDFLGIELPLQYEAIAFADVNFRWDYGSGPGVQTNRNFTPELAAAANHNPALRVMVGTGYYDLMTTIGDAEYTFGHAGIPAERVELNYYESGHMPYLGAESRRQVAADLRRFVTTASQQR